MLQHLARSNGGQCFDLKETSDAEIIAGMARPTYRPLPVTVASGKVLESELFTSTTGPDADRVTLVGRLDGPIGIIDRSYLAAGPNPQQERRFTIDGTAPAEGSLLRRLWAQRKLDDLLIHEQRNRQEIIALGKEFGLVTPFTSLMVLETLQQYLQYQIEPRKSLPAMRTAYLLQHGGPRTGSELLRSTAVTSQERGQAV